MNFIYEIVKFIVDLNYKRKLEKLKNKEKINVVFLVSENQKWSYQSLFDELKKIDKFNLKILISFPKDLKIENKDEYLKKNFEFYSKIDKNAQIIFKYGKYESLKKYNPDIVFYEQQWGLPRIYKPYYVSFFALTYFSCYGVQMFDFKQDYTKTFHYYLFKYLVDFKENFLRFKKYNKKFIKNCVLTGYPKLDYLFDKDKISSEKIKIVYAPHHSFSGGLNVACFKEFGYEVLNLAKKYTEFEFVFKPHPRFKTSVIENKIINSEEIEKYYSDWQKTGEIFDSGNYFDLFNSSSLLITDCCSFLGEYYFFNKPVIRLENNNSLELNDFGKKIVKEYSCIKNPIELEKKLIEILNSKKNFKRTVFLKKKSSYIVLKHLINVIK